ncbi:hypothetical protein Syun_021147 [Stephania yunnanensis]|uniref:Uncharacterized protein n=1 Tax=Stephania yunnanensis TaxID=152371 RepID=A0AAP0IFI8_9MAGN
MVTIHLRYELLSGLIGVCGYLIVARFRAGRQGSRLEPESAGLFPRLNDLLETYSAKSQLLESQDSDRTICIQSNQIQSMRLDIQVLIGTKLLQSGYYISLFDLVEYVLLEETMTRDVGPAARYVSLPRHGGRVNELLQGLGAYIGATEAISRVADQTRRRLVTISEPVEDCYDIPFQFNGNAAFSGGGFTPSTGYPDHRPSLLSRQESDSQGLLPLTVKQINDTFNSSDDKSSFTVDGVDAPSLNEP